MYEAVVLTEQSRRLLLQLFKPKYSRVVAHHVTTAFGVRRNESANYGALVPLSVVGYACEDGVEALVVEIDNTTIRADKRTYHITLSLDVDKKPVMSNTLLKGGWCIKYTPIPIEGTFEYIQ